jgi:membrane-associated phospholipid phosphatase
LRYGGPLPLIVAIAILGLSDCAWAQTSAESDTNPADTNVPQPAPPSPTAQSPQEKRGLLTDVKLYFTSPLRWNAQDWAWVGGALAFIGATHGYDSQVRTHFVNGRNPSTINSDDAQDAAPTVAVLLGTWASAIFFNDSDGRREAWTMQEAAFLTTATVYPLKYIVAREGPYQTSNANEWRKSGGNSFPSAHAGAAFAVGMVLAESGSDDYRWVRRLLGYGLGIGTSYLRLKHNAHWLSDTAAGAALGTASAHFSMNRNYRSDEDASSGLMLVPVEGGVMLTYRVNLE